MTTCTWIILHYHFAGYELNFKKKNKALLDHFFTKYCLENEKFLDSNRRSALKFEPDAMPVLMEHNWPGNVRELENSAASVAADAHAAGLQ